MVKVTYILSLIFKSLEYEWIVRYLDKSKIKLSFILLNPEKTELESFLLDHDIEVKRVPYYSKKSYPRAIISTYKLLKRIKPNFINCNLLDANNVGLTAGLLAGVKNRIHTRHHSTFHHVYYPKGRVYDLYANRLSTQIVAVSSLVKNVLIEKEMVEPEKIKVIPHGFGIDDFNSVSQERIMKLREKYSIKNESLVIGSISRYIEWKGVQYIIPAFKKVLEKYPNAIFLIANARQGEHTDSILKQLEELPNDSYREIIFESDILAFYKLLDVFIHVPVDEHSEAYGRIYPECLASGVPMVCTISGIAHDIIKHEYNALVVPYRNSTAITENVIKILESKNLKESLSTNGRKSAYELANIETQKILLENLYLG
jgi:glycosyltransferase involved in cell wall biosynthesis